MLTIQDLIDKAHQTHSIARARNYNTLRQLQRYETEFKLRFKGKSLAYCIKEVGGTYFLDPLLAERELLDRSDEGVSIAQQIEAVYGEQAKTLFLYLLSEDVE